MDGMAWGDLGYLHCCIGGAASHVARAEERRGQATSLARTAGAIGPRWEGGGAFFSLRLAFLFADLFLGISSGSHVFWPSWAIGLGFGSFDLHTTGGQEKKGGGREELG